MQLVVSGNRILAHGEDFLAMGGTVICPSTGRTYQNATVVECDGCPSDIDKVGYEYHAGRFIPCAPFGVGDGNLAVVCGDDCKSIKDSGVPLERVKLAYSLKDATVIETGADLNNYTGFGNYVASDDIARNLKNCPIAKGFVLHVERCSLSMNNICKQRIVTYNKAYEYWRIFNNGSFGAWQITYTTANPPTPDEVGAIPLTRGAYSSLGVARLKDVRTPGSYRIAISATGTLPTDWPDEFKDVKYGFGVLTVEQGDSYLVQELTTVATDVEGFTRKATRMLTEKKDSPWVVTMMNNGQVQITTYDGTGGVGVDAPTEVTFNFVPKIVFVTVSSPDNKCRQVTTFIHGISNVKGWYSEDINGGRLTATWDDENKKLSWYARGTWSYDGDDPELTAGYQLNAAQYVYTAVAMA